MSATLVLEVFIMTQKTQSKLVWFILGVLLSPFIIWFFLFDVLPVLLILFASLLVGGAWIVVGILIMAFLFMATVIHPN